MLRKSFVIILLATGGCSNCQPDGDKVSRECPPPAPCVISNGAVITTFVPLQGQCRPGQTHCNENNQVAFCLGYVGPKPELCDNFDNDCDGNIDNGFDQDKDGFTVCQNDCNDQNSSINPSGIELCNNVDDNCNGTADENVTRPCWSGPAASIFNLKSQCQRGFTRCKNGEFEEICYNQVLPSLEICDNIDNNCDGNVDERVPNSCGYHEKIGICKRGDQICLGNETLCIDSVYPSLEICDNIDNNCDGNIDENLKKICQTACGIGEEICLGGSWKECSARIPQPEICNNVDDDCDGKTDEDCPCRPGSVERCFENIKDPISGRIVNCGIGAHTCVDGFRYSDCIKVGTEQEACDNWDNDCDGIIDNFSQVCGSSAIGECQLGSRRCVNGFWQRCIGSVEPSLEICDGRDNDCNGQIDDGLIIRNKVDLIFAIDISGSMCDKIMALKAAMAMFAMNYTGTQHRFGLLLFPGYFINQWHVRLLPPSNINLFINVLNLVDCNGQSIEPSLDILFWLTDPMDAMMLALWRIDAYPYVVMVLDEDPQFISNFMNTNDAIQQIIGRTQNCRVGSCRPGDQYEVFIIGDMRYRSDWLRLANNNPNHLISILPPDTNLYYRELRSKVLANVCMQP